MIDGRWIALFILTIVATSFILLMLQPVSIVATVQNTVDTFTAQPDHDKRITVENDADKAVTVRLTVTKQPSGLQVHSSTTTVQPEQKTTLYNLNQADPTRIQSFDIRVQFGEQERGMRMQTRECYGDATIRITTEGELETSRGQC